MAKQVSSTLTLCCVEQLFHVFICSAALLEDYTVPSPFTVVFPAGGTDSTLCSNVVITNDNALEDDHGFTVVIANISSSSPHATINVPSSTTVTIEDDEGEVNYQ